MILTKVFDELKIHSEGALISFVVGGDPTLKHTSNVIEALAKGGADIVEVGFPFSDPIADGPTIQAGNTRALNSGTTPSRLFKVLKKVSKSIDTPLAILTYYNLLFKMNVEKFLGKVQESGVDGVIVADLPVEEAGEYIKAANKKGVDTIFLASPSTPLDRLKKIITLSSGFLYLISVFGVTGTRAQLSDLTTRTVKAFHPYTKNKIPLAVGFGVSNPEQVRLILQSGAEGAIVGSAFVKKIENNLNSPRKMLNEIKLLTENLKTATINR